MLFSGVFVVRTLEEEQQYFSNYCCMGDSVFGEQPSRMFWCSRMLQALAWTLKSIKGEVFTLIIVFEDSALWAEGAVEN